MCQSQSPNSSHPLLSPLDVIHVFSTPVSLFLLCKKVRQYHFSRFHIHMDLETVIHSEVSQKEKNRYHVLTHISEIKAVS